MRRSITALLVFAASACGAELCPWMNAATAGGFLRTPVSVSVTHETNNRDDTACTFQSSEGTAKRELRIDVQTMDTPRSEYKTHAAQCESNAVALRAIGNEAVLCGPDSGDGGRRIVQVVGRVRTRIFTISVSTTDSAPEAAALRETTRAIAEQIAGVLF